VEYRTRRRNVAALSQFARLAPSGVPIAVVAVRLWPAMSTTDVRIPEDLAAAATAPARWLLDTGATAESPHPDLRARESLLATTQGRKLAAMAVAGHEHLSGLHGSIQQAFSWEDDHLYSFWLDGEFWGDGRASSLGRGPQTPTHAQYGSTRWPQQARSYPPN
jgi:hypothetical protein